MRLLTALTTLLIAPIKDDSYVSAFTLVGKHPSPSCCPVYQSRSSERGRARVYPIHSRHFAQPTDEELGLKRVKIGDQDFWTRQKELANEMSASAGRSLKEEQQEKFSKRRLALVGDTAYFGFFIFCGLWASFDNPFVAISYLFGASMGLAYAYGLGKYVETLGGSAEDAASTQGAGLGEARFAFLILLFVIVGKFRSSGLIEIPAIAGFFTYQLASLRQGLREIND